MKKSSKRFMSLAVSAVLVAPIFLASVPPVIYAQDNVSAISEQQVLNLSQVKQLTKNSKVTTQGVVVNPPGTWGGTGFIYKIVPVDFTFILVRDQQLM